MPDRNKQLAHDVVAYTRRKAQYVRPRMRMPEKTVEVPERQSVEGIFRSHTPHPQAAAALQTDPVRSHSRKHFDIIVHKQEEPKSIVATTSSLHPSTPTEETVDQDVKGTKWRLIPVFAAILILIGGFGIFAMTLRTNQEVVAQMSDSTNTESEEAPPVESEISEEVIRSYQVGPQMPKVLTIEDLSVRGRIMRLGTLGSGALAAPSNIFDAGWYEGSSRPGDGGAVLLVGHVHGPSKPGIFKDLHEVKDGAVITITRGDDTDFSYRVVKKEQVAADAVDMATALIPVTPGKAGLNIITCAGELIPGTTKYADRVIVYAEAL